jgi:lysophospholipase L1-like esterase
MTKKFIKHSIIAACIILACELFARFILGLGNPPLYKAHPTIEYMLRPDQDVRRFGNRYIVNEYGMRSPSFPIKNDGFRVLVFGDSVINGGNLTDQKDLGTTQIQKKLTQEGAKNAVVGNISAGSWGPGNWLAYAEEYGFFDADVVVLVISSHDAGDNPSFNPLDQDHPTRRPLFAVEEGVSRYLARYFHRRTALKADAGMQPEDVSAHESAVQKGLADLTAFLLLAQSRAGQVLVFQHLTSKELQASRPDEGYFRIRDACVKSGIEPVLLAPYFKEEISLGNDPYRDDIHPNAIGQRALAKAIEGKLVSSGFINLDN